MKRTLLSLVWLLWLPMVAAADEVRTIRLTDPLPYGQQPIDYHGAANDDAVARLNERLEAGEVALSYDEDRGWLLSLLEALGVPVESQVLVFSRTALNPQLVGPKTPRAIFFNDEVYVGWVPGAAALEVSAVDPLKGAVFYGLHQNKDAPRRLTRETRCIACHAGETTLQVPGHMVRAFLTDDLGKPLSGYSRITHETALSKRWAGWYVTGTHGRQTHSGNVAGLAANDKHRADPSFGSNVTDLAPYLDAGRYPSPHSDIVVHLVLNHQAHGQNLLTRVGHESRLGRRSDAEDRLARYLLFLDEAPLTAPVAGTSGFTEWFERQHPHDPQRHSLRAFDLKTRLFKHRLSYLIDTPAFTGLPEDVRSRLFQKMRNLLTDPPEDGAAIPPDERTVLLEMLKQRRRGTAEDGR